MNRIMSPATAHTANVVENLGRPFSPWAPLVIGWALVMSTRMISPKAERGDRR